MSFLFRIVPPRSSVVSIGRRGSFLVALSAVSAGLMPRAGGALEEPCLRHGMAYDTSPLKGCCRATLVAV